MHRYSSAACFGTESHSLHYSHPSKRSVFSGKFTSSKVSIWFTKIIRILLYSQSCISFHFHFWFFYFPALPRFLHSLVFPAAEEFCHVIVISAHNLLSSPSRNHSFSYPLPALSSYRLPWCNRQSLLSYNSQPLWILHPCKDLTPAWCVPDFFFPLVPFQSTQNKVQVLSDLVWILGLFFFFLPN